MTMFDVVIALVFLAVGMYISISVIDFVFTRFNLFPNKDINNKKFSSEFSSAISFPFSFDLGVNHSTQAVNYCDLETVCAQVTENADTVAEGVITALEVTGESIINLVEGL